MDNIREIIREALNEYYDSKQSMLVENINNDFVKSTLKLVFEQKGIKFEGNIIDLLKKASSWK